MILLRSEKTWQLVCYLLRAIERKSLFSFITYMFVSKLFICVLWIIKYLLYKVLECMMYLHVTKCLFELLACVSTLEFNQVHSRLWEFNIITCKHLFWNIPRCISEWKFSWGFFLINLKKKLLGKIFYWGYFIVID